MNEIERAIKHFEGLQKRYTTQHNGKHCDLVATALDALRERAEMEKSEQWCKKETNGGLLAICPKCNYPVSWWYKTPFCANCGKRLEVEP